MTCYCVTITVASRPENRTSGTRRAELPVLGVGMGKSSNGRGYMLQEQHPRRGDSKAVPLEPRFIGGCPPRKGSRPCESRPTVRRLDIAKAGRSGLALGSLAYLMSLRFRYAVMASPPSASG
jgi:hypothetical protein